MGYVERMAMLTRGLTASALALVFTSIVPSDGALAQAPGRNRGLQQFEARLAAMRSEVRIPGITAAIAKGQRIVWARGFGRADVSGNRPATDTTVYHLASLTKPFAATIVLQLVNEGKVSLDDPVAKYGITLRGRDTIRVRHLLSHTSEGTPGTAYRYSGDRFARLDAVIQQADRRTFATALHERIVKPLRLRWIAPNPGSPHFAESGFDMGTFYRNFAHGYSSGTTQAPTAYPTHFSTAAGLVASAREVLRFSMALDRDALLPPALKELAFTPTRTNAGQVTPYGLGWFTTEYHGVKVVWHYGYWTANSSLIIKVPDRELTFVLLANTAALSERTQLGSGLLETSPWAREFLDRFVIGDAQLP
jgi:CubicO group peptidase (beta-lactamase class C family)